MSDDENNAGDAYVDVNVEDAQEQPAPVSTQEPPKDTADGQASAVELQTKADEKEDAGADADADAAKGDDANKRPDLYDADGDGIADEEMFEGSTHSFIIYYGMKKNVSGLIVSIFVLAMQMVLYVVCAAQVMGDLSGDEFTVPVQVRFGESCTTPDETSSKFKFICPPVLPDLGYVALAAVLLSFFLMHDIIAGVRVWITIPGCLAKLAGFIILFESLFAAIVGILFAVGATSGYDAIASCIGVLFIHDADEKAFEAFQMINTETLRQSKLCRKCQCACCKPCCHYLRVAIVFVSAFAIMVISLIIGAALRAGQKQNIIDIYGDDWWGDNFSSSGFDYWGGWSSWDTNADTSGSTGV